MRFPFTASFTTAQRLQPHYALRPTPGTLKLQKRNPETRDPAPCTYNTATLASITADLPRHNPASRTLLVIIDEKPYLESDLCLNAHGSF